MKNKSNLSVFTGTIVILLVIVFGAFIHLTSRIDNAIEVIEKQQIKIDTLNKAVNKFILEVFPDKAYMYELLLTESEIDELITAVGQKYTTGYIKKYTYSRLHAIADEYAKEGQLKKAIQTYTTTMNYASKDQQRILLKNIEFLKAKSNKL